MRKPRRKILSGLLILALASGMTPLAIYAADYEATTPDKDPFGLSVGAFATPGVEITDNDADEIPAPRAAAQAANIEKIPMAAGTYNADDIAAINKIITINWSGSGATPELAPDDGSSVPDGWGFVEWSDDPTDKRVTKLDLVDRDMTISLDLSDLTALEELDLAYNNFTEINLSQNTALVRLSLLANNLEAIDLSHNTELVDLNIGGNGLADIDISQNTLLEALNCADNKLTSLDISGLTALKELRCNYNEIAALDVSGSATLEYLACGTDDFLISLDVSGCTALKELDCYVSEGGKGGPTFTSREGVLDTLDASGCIALETIYCDGNMLTSLNVSGCSALETLYCRSNELTSLDVSDCIALKLFNCSENHIPVIDLSASSALSYLACASNELTSLDPSGLTLLEELWCGDNKFTALDVSGMTSLVTLDCMSGGIDGVLTALDVSGCTSLETLFCGDNKLTSLDVSGLTALVSLYCPGSELKALDLSECSSLEMLMCYNNKLATLDVSDCTALTTLHCHSNNMTSKSSVMGFTGVWDGMNFSFDPQNTGGSTPDPKPNPEPDNESDDNDDDADNGSSGGGGYYSGGTTSAAAAKPSPTIVTQAQGVNSVNTAVAEGGSARLLNPGMIALGVMQAMDNAAGVNEMNINADSLAQGGAVDVRVTFNPGSATKDVNLAGSTLSENAAITKNTFERYFENIFSTVELAQEGDYGMTVGVAAKLDSRLAGAEALYFYSYDTTANTYRRLPITEYWIDANGYVHFNTNTGGIIVITDSPLERR